MVNGNEQAMEGEETLAHLLEFLSKLEESVEVRGKVIEEIKEKVKGYVKDDGQKFSSSSSGYLFETIKKCQKLRSDIVKQENTYRHYSDLKDGDANKYSQHLINNIFPLFGCLYYMYYECAGDCYGIGAGGQWWDEKCDGTGSGRDKDHLNKWLKDQKGDKTHMISRGFQEGELSQKDGKDLFPLRGSGQTGSKSLLDYLQGAQLQWALYFMLFLPNHTKWNNAQSGHAVLFLQAFCEEITGGEFDDDHTAAKGSGDDKFKKGCQTVTGSIQKLLSSNTIVPVASSDTVKYKDLMADEHFGSYIKWLQGILPKLKESLTKMEKDVDNWEKSKLISSSTYGPYFWGFTFQSHWESNKAQLNESLQNLITSLSGLQNALPPAWNRKRRSKKGHEKSSSPTDSTASTASTVGGVAAGLGAAAGAAYAGSGILGPAAEAIGKFFRGLFL